MHQDAPWPYILEKLVERCEYRPGWKVKLVIEERDSGSAVRSKGLTLSITTVGYDSYNHENDNYRVQHQFPVPPATYNEQSWLRWLFEQFLTVERHEAMEFFALRPACTCPEGKYEEGYHEDGCALKVGKLVRPYAPNHGPGHDPYVIHDMSTDEERRTRFTGQVLPSA